MISFNFNTPTRLIFGEGTAASACADVLSEFGAHNPLVVSDRVLAKSGVLAPVLDSLAQNDIRNPAIFDDVPSDSDLACVRRAVELARRSSCDSLLAVGGGSVMDTAKGINIGLSLGGDILDFEGINCIPSRLLPLVAIPTTAGTGSEVSAVATIKDHDQQKKILFGSRFLYADAAILDPALLVSLPPGLTAATGLDAVTHALESFVAVAANPISDALALPALSLLMTYLPRATRSGDDLEARSNTLVASTMAGISFSNAGVGIVHALAHALGAKYGLHHGQANAVFLPHGIEFNMDECTKRYAHVWSYLCRSFSIDNGGNEHLSAKFVPGSCERESANLLLNAVKDLLNQCSCPVRLRDLGVPALDENNLNILAHEAMTDPAIMFNPKEATHEELVNIIKRAY